MNMKPIEEAKYGVYVWEVTGRGILVNENHDPLRVNAFKGDLSKMAEIRRAAAHYGFPDGKPVFWAGKRAISESEYEDQMVRQAQGEIADPYDIPALIDRMNRDDE